MPNTYDTDGFRTLTLRADKASRTAFCEGLQNLHYGDAITLVVSGVQGCTPASLVFGIYDPDSTCISIATTAFAFVPGCVDKVYAQISLLTVEAAAATAALAPGVPVEVRVYLYETGGKTWLDTSASLYPNPAVSGGDGTACIAYVTAGDLAALATSVAAMPSLNAAQREARFNALLVGLQALCSS